MAVLQLEIKPIQPCMLKWCRDSMAALRSGGLNHGAGNLTSSCMLTKNQPAKADLTSISQKKTNCGSWLAHY